MQYDTVHGRYQGTVEAEDHKLIVDGKTINISNELDPTKINWGASGADYIVESTGTSFFLPFFLKNSLKFFISQANSSLVRALPSTLWAEARR